MAETAFAGSDIIVTDAAVDYAPGEKIVITSSGYDFHETEEVTVVGLDADNHTVTIDPPLRFDHIAQIYEFEGETMDMRCEVGLLSRNIIIQGDDNSPAQLYGSHTIASGSGTLR